jgi:hypothetical protein
MSIGIDQDEGERQNDENDADQNVHGNFHELEWNINEVNLRP